MLVELVEIGLVVYLLDFVVAFGNAFINEGAVGYLIVTVLPLWVKHQVLLNYIAVIIILSLLTRDISYSNTNIWFLHM